MNRIAPKGQIISPQWHRPGNSIAPKGNIFSIQQGFQPGIFRPEGAAYFNPKQRFGQKDPKSICAL